MNNKNNNLLYSIYSADNEIRIEEYNLVTNVLEPAFTVKILEPCEIQRAFSNFLPKIDKTYTLAVCHNQRVYFYNSQNIYSWYRDEGLSDVVFSEIIQFESERNSQAELNFHSIEEVFSRSFNLNFLSGFFNILKSDLVEIYNRIKNNVELLIENKNQNVDREWKIYLIAFTSSQTLFIFDAYDGTVLYKK